MIHLTPRPWAKRCLGISAIEILVTVACPGLCATLTFFVVSGDDRNAHHARLAGDVQTPNSALKTYEVDGADFSRIPDPRSVLSLLKTSLNKVDRERHVGPPSEGMIGSRVVAVAADSEIHVHEGATAQGEGPATFTS